MILNSLNLIVYKNQKVAAEYIKIADNLSCGEKKDYYYIIANRVITENIKLMNEFLQSNQDKEEKIR